jgi:predicted Zn-dependent protease
MVDPQSLLLTGLTRDGVYLIEDGKVQGAVNNFRFNMSPLDMLRGVTEMGESTLTLAREFGDYFLFSKTPPIRVKDWNMSSVSQAT